MAARTNSGAICRQGPHHGAQKSTSTGTLVRETKESNELSSSSVTEASSNGVLQPPHFGPWCMRAASTRFCARHFGQATWTNSGAALATVVGVLIEVPLVLALVRFCLKTQHWFPESADAGEARATR